MQRICLVLQNNQQTSSWSITTAPFCMKMEKIFWDPLRNCQTNGKLLLMHLPWPQP